MSPHRIWLVIPANLEAIRFAAAALQGILRDLACDDDHAPMIELCVVEAINNAIEHAYAEVPRAHVETKLTIDGDMLEIAVIDSGKAMPDGMLDLARARLLEPPGEPQEGGYGLGLIVEIMSGVQYHRSAHLNTLTMTTTLRRRAA